jgi:hypothetical protein
LAGLIVVLALYAGAFSAIFWAPGIFVALGAVGGLLIGHLIVGVVAYRRVMSRPWPKVKPLEDDEDW